MAEVLLCVTDRTNPDSAALDLACYKAGDIIIVCPDGWGWSQLERSNPDWVIVQAPGIADDALRDMLSVTLNPAGKFVRRRSRAIDMTKPVIQEVLASLDPENRVYTLNTGTKRTQFLAARFTKAAVDEPVVLD